MEGGKREERLDEAVVGTEIGAEGSGCEANGMEGEEMEFLGDVERDSVSGISPNGFDTW